jgi:hypothetical protein
VRVLFALVSSRFTVATPFGAATTTSTTAAAALLARFAVFVKFGLTSLLRLAVHGIVHRGQIVVVVGTRFTRLQVIGVIFVAQWPAVSFCLTAATPPAAASSAAASSGLLIGLGSFAVRVGKLIGWLGRLVALGP